MLLLPNNIIVPTDSSSAILWSPITIPNLHEILQVQECVRLLLEHSVLVNVHDKYHMSPLMLCARHSYCGALELLCQNNVDINKQDQVM